MISIKADIVLVLIDIFSFLLRVGYLLYNVAIAKCLMDSYFVVRSTMQRFRASNNGGVKCLSCALVFV